MRPVGSETLVPDADGVRRGQLRFCRLTFLVSVALALPGFAMVAFAPTSANINWGVVLIVVYMALFLWCGLYALQFFYAYSDQKITVRRFNLKTRTHDVTELKAIKAIPNGNNIVLVFGSTGKARIPTRVEGRGALLRFAREKLNNG